MNQSPSSHTSEHHCASYYAATRNDQTTYAPLASDVDADVCIIGGGFTGVATALTLAERGYRVVLLEQNYIGWGASGRNGGQMLCGISGTDRLIQRWGENSANRFFELGYRGHEIIRDRIGRYDIDCDLKAGSFTAALKPRHMRDNYQWAEEFESRGLSDKYRLVERHEMCDVLGTDAYIGGLINWMDGHLHPLNLCLGEARAAASLGVEIHEQTKALRIRHGSRPEVDTAKGRVTADALILAGNAYHHLEQKSLAGLMIPVTSFIIATERLSEQEAVDLNPLDLAVCDQNEVLDYYRLSADRRLLYGGQCNYSGREPQSIEAAMRPLMLRIFPQLTDKRIDYQWGGQMGFTVKRVPLLGRTSTNVFYAMGYCGHGVNVSHIAGEVMADAVGGTLENFDMFEKMNHFRIPMGRQLGNPLFALGMLFYRLMDLR